MSEKTREKILLAIAYLFTHGIEINITRISRYSQLSWATVNKYLKEVFPSEFMLDDIRHYHKHYDDKNSVKEVITND